MSEYQQREGTAKLLDVPANYSFEDAVQYICETQINFTYSLVEEDFVEWEHANERVVYVNGQFWHIIFTVKTDGYPYVRHGFETTDGISFICMYHDSGTYFENEFDAILSDLSEISLG